MLRSFCSASEINFQVQQYSDLSFTGLHLPEPVARGIADAQQVNRGTLVLVDGFLDEPGVVHRPHYAACCQPR